jgi:hypothetical protein
MAVFAVFCCSGSEFTASDLLFLAEILGFARCGHQHNSGELAVMPLFPLFLQIAIPL